MGRPSRKTQISVTIAMGVGLCLLAYAFLRFPALQAMDPALDAAFDKEPMQAGRDIDLMDKLPPWLKRDMASKNFSSALIDKAGLVCGTAGTEALICNKSITVPATAGHCEVAYQLDAAFEADRLTKLTGRRTKICG